MIIVRYADDFIVGFQDESDARPFLDELREAARASPRLRLAEAIPWLDKQVFDETQTQNPEIGPFHIDG